MRGRGKGTLVGRLDGKHNIIHITIISFALPKVSSLSAADSSFPKHVRARRHDMRERERARRGKHAPNCLVDFSVQCNHSDWPFPVFNSPPSSCRRYFLSNYVCAAKKLGQCRAAVAPAVERQTADRPLRNSGQTESPSPLAFKCSIVWLRHFLGPKRLFVYG